MRNRVIVSVAVMLLLCAAGVSAKTLDNLQAAYNGESNAHARYLAFAEKAQAEGYAGVANLFRAAAKAEEIHANNHAAVIRELGAAPKATIEKPAVGSTKDNIAAAIKGETYERDTMYPKFIAEARADKNNKALRTFNFAKSAEAGHADLYTAASKDLEKMKAKDGGYYVCEVCGNTVKTVGFEKCPVCFNPKDKYVAVS